PCRFHCFSAFVPRPATRSTLFPYTTLFRSLVRVGDSPRWPAGEFVVKPAVGAGSVGARRFGPRQHGPAAEHLAVLHAEGREALIQPYQRDVDARGEIAQIGRASWRERV